MKGHLTRRFTRSALGAALVAVALLPLTSGASSAAATPAGSAWNLVFADDFNNAALDTSKWHTCSWWAPSTCSIETNSELELYTPNNVSVANGALDLQARKESAVGWNGKNYGYTSGMVSSGGSMYSEPAKKAGFAFTYGYVEARVKVPAGKGLWPALWLLPDDHSWPPEIDVMEILGDKPTETNMHYHFTKADGTLGDVGTAWTGPDFSAGWHTFGVDWEPGALVWYVDGVERARYTGSDVTAKASYVLLNLAVGGTWPGSPDASTAFPADYLVDYLYVYQRAGASAPAPTADTAAPTVNLMFSAARNSTTVGISGSAKDNLAVVRMALLIDGVTKATGTTGSLSYSWNTRNVSRGAHAITVKAWDAAGNVGQSSTSYTR